MRADANKCNYFSGTYLFSQRLSGCNDISQLVIISSNAMQYISLRSPNQYYCLFHRSTGSQHTTLRHYATLAPHTYQNFACGEA